MKELIRSTIAGIITVSLWFIIMFNSHSWSWPTTYSYSGPREKTKWGLLEASLNDISIFFIYSGIVLIVFSLIINQYQSNQNKAN